jgi:hypothetical protein
VTPRPSFHLKLIDRKTRVVELWAPESSASRFPTDRELFALDLGDINAYMAGPRSVGRCYEAHGRRSRFLIDETPTGDRLIATLAARRVPVTGVKPFGPRGWVAETQRGSV